MHSYNFRASGNILMRLFQPTCREAEVITCIQFLEGPPPKIWEGQKTSKFRRDFWQLLTLIANISAKGEHVKNLKSSWSTKASPRLDKKPRELWSTYEKGAYWSTQVTWLDQYAPFSYWRGHFSGKNISALKGCCALKFLYALEINQALLAHSTPGTRVTPKKNCNRENLKFGLIFSMCVRITPGLVGISSWNFSRRYVARQGDNVRTIFRRPAPKIWEGQKTSKFRRDFWQLSTLIANISGTTPDIQNRKEMRSTAIPLAFHEKSPVNFGPQSKKFYWLTLSHPSGFFGEGYISALRRCCPLKFLYALEIDQAL